MDESCGAKGAKNHVHAPLNILECWRREKGEAKVARPVEKGGDGHRFGANV